MAHFMPRKNDDKDDAQKRTPDGCRKDNNKPFKSDRLVPNAIKIDDEKNP
jgi:hypothetical protein